VTFEDSDAHTPFKPREVLMKRALIIIVLLSVAIFCFAEALQMGIGADFNGKHKVKTSSMEHTWDVETGYSVYAEYMLQSSYFLYGAGAEYQIPRTVTFTGGEGKVGFIPVYFVARLQAPEAFIVRPLVVGQIGYSFLAADKDYKGSADITGGFYWGFGGGVQLQRLVLQIMYKVDTGKLKQEIGTSTIEADVTQSQVNISAGFSY
jgi:hypothetical protein